jgi:hypothetical protein
MGIYQNYLVISALHCSPDGMAEWLSQHGSSSMVVGKYTIWGNMYRRCQQNGVNKPN